MTALNICQGLIRIMRPSLDTHGSDHINNEWEKA